MIDIVLRGTGGKSCDSDSESDRITISVTFYTRNNSEKQTKVENQNVKKLRILS